MARLPHSLPARNETQDAHSEALSLATQLTLLCVDHLRSMIQTEVLAALEAQARPPTLRTREECARELNICGKTLSKLVAQGLPVVRLGAGTERYELDRVLDWLRTR